MAGQFYRLDRTLFQGTDSLLLGRLAGLTKPLHSTPESAVHPDLTNHRHVPQKGSCSRGGRSLKTSTGVGVKNQAELNVLLYC